MKVRCVVQPLCPTGGATRLAMQLTPMSLCSERANGGPLLSPPKKGLVPPVHPLQQMGLPAHSAGCFTLLHPHTTLQVGTSLLSCKQALWVGGPATVAAPAPDGSGRIHASSVIKKRRKKMNKHKYRKRRREQRFLRRRHGRS